MIAGHRVGNFAAIENVAVHIVGLARASEGVKHQRAGAAEPSAGSRDRNAAAVASRGHQARARVHGRDGAIGEPDHEV